MTLPEGVEEVLPLTPAQRGMLFHVLEDAAPSGRYVAVLTCHLDGVIDTARFEQAIQSVIKARDAYRAGFVWEGLKQPLQALRSDITVPIFQVDWSDKSDAAVREALGELVETEQQRRFDLSRAPLMAFHLLRRSGNHHILVWTIHHLISDGWSTRVVLDELFRHYAGSSKTAPVPAQFRNVLSWIRKSKLNVANTAYWTNHFSDLENPCRLSLAPLDQPASGHGRVTHDLGRSLSNEVKRTARHFRVTENTLLSAAWALTLRHLTGQSDVVFGQTYAGRPPEVPGSSKAAGAFINTLPMRIKIAPKVPVSALLVQMEALQRAHLPHEFAALSEVKALAPIPKGAALFDTLFVNEAVGELPKPNACLSLRDLTTVQSSNYTLAMLVSPGDTWACELYFDKAQVSPALAAEIIARYSAIIAGILATPTRRVDQTTRDALPPLQVPQTQSFDSVLTRFLAAAERSPDAPSVSDARHTLSYRELETKARQIAAALARAGVRPGAIVPVALPREADTLAAFLGVWMVGGAYVPLDLEYPASRIKQIFECVGPSHVISKRGYAGELPQNSAKTVLTDELDASEEFTAQSGDLAYVIFTSGSQGAPKGVVISQTALATSIGVRDEVYREVPEAYLLLSSLAFDSSVPGLYWPLATGGHVVVAPSRAEQNPEALGALCRHYRISHTLCLPSLARALFRILPERDFDTMRTWICAGEPMPADLCEQVASLAPNLRLFNEYGPTEATVWASLFNATGWRKQPVPIGKPLPCAWTGACDLDGAPLPAGIKGEIAIAGPMLAQGYLNAPLQTAQAFQSADTLHPRLYRTGDIGYTDETGVIRCIGRQDRQVKIRGHRVELAEIECVAARYLKGIPCIAILAENAIALCVEAPTDDSLVQDLCDALKGDLHASYAPEIIECIKPFPALPNGKTDTKALETQVLALCGKRPAMGEPQSAIERQIAGIFAETLSCDSVPADGNFFDLGGDSLKTLDAYERARKQGLGIKPIDIFDHPTARSLSQWILTNAAEEIGHTRVANVLYANKDGDREAVFIVHGTMQLFGQMTRGLGDRHPVGLLFSHYLFDLDLPLSVSVEDLAREAVDNLRSLRPEGPYILCAYSAGSAIALEMARMLGDEVQQMFLIDPPFQMLEHDPSPAPTAAVSRLRNQTRRALRLRVARHAARVAGLKALAPVLPRSEWRRRMLVRSAYVFSLSRYRIRRYERPVQLMITEGNPALTPGSATDLQLPLKQVTQLDYRHQDVISEPESVVVVAAKIISQLRNSA
ncbi:MAG: amino acid adenylation domain-containing protein [Pseudomonadota bacterium]